MSILVAYGPEGRGQGGLELARLLSDSSALPLVVCCVIPDRWSSVGPGRQVDRDYEQYLYGLADAALARARQMLGPVAAGVEVEVVTARSAPTGLLAAAERHGSRLLVTGSSSDGAWGHVALGSVTDRLLHSSHVPVAVAPRGYRSRAGHRVRRVTVAVDGTEGTQAVLGRAATVAHDVGAALRVVTFAVRAHPMYPPEVGLHAEDRVVAAWREQAATMVAQAVDALPADQREGIECLVAEAATWREALDEPHWAEGDVLVLGSSTSQSLISRVFLGSTATRILRHSPVPVVVVP
ncbi:MAG: universal stress protein [Kineosporiaceae bacterium]|nr:universal stress protein [Kineosporiaceae bacterium]